MYNVWTNNTYNKYNKYENEIYECIYVYRNKLTVNIHMIGKSGIIVDQFKLYI